MQASKHLVSVRFSIVHLMLTFDMLRLIQLRPASGRMTRMYTKPLARDVEKM